jgi:sporulation protein YlmC with PRC-barrel domain
MKLQFELLGKAVYTQNKKRLGKVADFALDVESFTVEKLYVGQNIVKNFSGTSLVVDKNQIVEITDKRIIIRDPLQGVPQAAMVSA